MRRIKPEFKFDIWIPKLAPSTKLLKSYHDKIIDWKEFEKEFTREVLEKQSEYLDVIISLAEKSDATILCWEPKGENCHRILVAKKLQQLNPLLKVKHI
jgi:uncharacterized protein YeaO (DUF488 family)